MSFQSLARIPVTHTPVTGVTQDGMGSDVPTFGTPVSRKAYSFGTHRTENLDGHTSQDVAERDLEIPPATVNLMDRFTVDGTTYETVGIRDYTGGFHGWKPGIVVELKKVTG